jgi:molecular chaperone GrpE
VGEDEYRMTIDELLQEEIELANKQERDVDPLPQVDLRILLSELIRLKSEVRVETQSAREQRDRQKQTLEMLEQAFQRIDEGKRALSESVQNVREQEMRRAALALVDIADRLESTLRGATVQPRRVERLFGGNAHRFVQSLRDGVSITMRRVDGYLSRFGVERIQSVGKAFDPNLMEAVQTVYRRDLPEGIVTEEITAGYLFLHSPLRDAQVVVNRKQTDRTEGIVQKLREATERRLSDLFKLVSSR